MDREISAEIRRLQNQIAELQRIVFGLPIRLATGGGGGGGLAVYEAYSVAELPADVNRKSLGRIMYDETKGPSSQDENVGRWYARTPMNAGWQEIVVPRWYPGVTPPE